MSAAFRRGGRSRFEVKLLDHTTEEWASRPTKTRDPVTAKRMQAMIDSFHAARAWEIVDQMLDRTRLVPEVYDIYLEENRDIDRVKIRMQDVDIEPFVKEWLKNPGGKAMPGSDTANHYEYHVRNFIPKGKLFPIHRFTSVVIQQHLDELTVVPGGLPRTKTKLPKPRPASPATKRKAAAAISSFARFLFRRGVLKQKPMRDVELPPPAPPRIHYIDTPDAIRLADAQPGQYRNYSAVLAGSAIDVSICLGLRPRDVERQHREARAPGTKTYTRDRMVRIADWAWPYLEELLKGKHPDARIFDEIPDRWRAAAMHNEAVKALVAQGHAIFKGYTMRDHRHTWAVRAARSGIPAELGARQMGHADAVLFHRVYGRFMPRQEEREKWELIASAQDAERQRHSKAGFNA